MELTKYKCGMFAKRDTIDAAMQYGYDIAESAGVSDPANKIAVMTALHVLLNTVIDIVEKEEVTV